MNTARSASAQAPLPASLPRPRRQPAQEHPVGSAIHVHPWDMSTNVHSKRVQKRTPEQAELHAIARENATKERHQRLAKLPPPRPVAHTAAWNGSTNLHSKRVNKRTSDQTRQLDVARAAAANERRQRLAKLSPSRPVVHASAWNASTNVQSKAVPRAATTRCDVKQVTRPCDRRAAPAPTRPFEPAFAWNASTNVASKRVNLPIRRPAQTRGAAHQKPECRPTAQQSAAQSAPRSVHAQTNQTKNPPMYIPPTWSKARVLVRAA